MLQIHKDVLIDRSDRSLAPRKPGGKPQAIVAKLHYFQDCERCWTGHASALHSDTTGWPLLTFQITLQGCQRQSHVHQCHKAGPQSPKCPFWHIVSSSSPCHSQRRQKGVHQHKKAMAYVKSKLVVFRGLMSMLLLRRTVIESPAYWHFFFLKMLIISTCLLSSLALNVQWELEQLALGSSQHKHLYVDLFLIGIMFTLTLGFVGRGGLGWRIILNQTYASLEFIFVFLPSWLFS